MKQKYQSEIMESIHEEAKALFEAGAIDENRMAEYDQACLLSKPNAPPAVNSALPAKRRQTVTPAYASKH
jgi:DNA-binding transcriptional regulator YiaG